MTIENVCHRFDQPSNPRYLGFPIFRQFPSQISRSGPSSPSFTIVRTSRACTTRVRDGVTGCMLYILRVFHQSSKSIDSDQRTHTRTGRVSQTKCSSSTSIDVSSRYTVELSFRDISSPFANRDNFNFSPSYLRERKSAIPLDFLSTGKPVSLLANLDIAERAAFSVHFSSNESRERCVCVAYKRTVERV